MQSYPDVLSVMTRGWSGVTHAIQSYSDVLTVMRGDWSGVISADTCNIVILRCTHCDEGGWSGVISADTCNIVLLRCIHCDEGELVRFDQCENINTFGKPNVQ